MFKSEDEYLAIMEEKSTKMGSCILCLSPLSPAEVVRKAHFMNHLLSTVAFKGETSGIRS